MSLRSQWGTLRATRILMMMLWLTLLKALDQSASKFTTAVGLFGSSVFSRIKLMMDRRAREQEAPGRAYCPGSYYFVI